MKIETMVVGKLATNCYIISRDGEACLVDPGDEAARILRYIEDNNFSLKYIFLTHGHFDHILAADEVREKTGAKLVIGEPDAGMLSDTRSFAIFTVGKKLKAMTADILVRDRDSFSACGGEFVYMHTPGHTPGSSVILFGDVIFSGDTLFEGDCGRCDLPGGDYAAMLKSLGKLYELEGDYKVYPGHDVATTLDRERESNADMRRAVGK